MELPIKPYHRRSSRNSGFTLVEVLIATLIMVVSIVTVTAALRQFTITRDKLSQYEQLYTTTLSVRDKIMGEVLSDNLGGNGTLNGLAYRYTCHLEQSANNYIVGLDEVQSGNSGSFVILLYKVRLDVGGKNFEFYKTQYKKPAATGKETF